MAFVRELGCERIEYDDRITGTHVTQITSFPVMSMHFYYEHPSFTPDSSTLIFRSQRTATRDSRWDLFACNADGMHLRQITDEEDADNFSLAATGHAVWYQRGTTLWRADLDSGQRVEIGLGPEGVLPMAYYVGCTSRDDSYYFGYGRRASDGWGVVIRYRTDGSEAVVLVAEPDLCHLHASPGGHGISFGGLDAHRQGVQYGIDYDGSNLRVLPTADLSHFTWVGLERKYLGAGMWPRRIIHMREDGQTDSTIIVEGSYFSHTGLSYDANWTVADTNWPNEGIMVVNIPVRQYARLCVSENTGGHPQWTHAHPAFSPDGNMVAYTSDRTGIMQVYVAAVSPEFKHRLATPQPDAAPGGRLADRRACAT